MNSTTKTIAKVHNVSILMIENGQKLVPIKPICEALGVDEDAQRRKIYNDEILSSVAVLSTATGSDGKQYKMNCLPFRFIFGWLFTINPKNVSPEAREVVLSYKLECYEALFKHFTDMQEYLEYKQSDIEEKVDKVDGLRKGFKNARNLLTEAQKELSAARNLTFEAWKAKNRQMKIDFEESEEES